MTDRRRQARESALQALYLWEAGRVTPQQAVDTYFREHQPDADETVRALASQLVHGVAPSVPDLDRIIEQHTRNWRIDRLSMIDRLILRMAAWELQQRETPPAVVLNEAIELARTFGTDESVRFVNGVLDAIRKTLEGPGPRAKGPEEDHETKDHE
jgi:N utilization substance protein B